jgi:predicted transglutaminase-like cysteine proteinase
MRAITALVAAALLAVAIPSPAALAQGQTAIFGAREVASRDLSGFTKWNGTMMRAAHPAGAQDACRPGACLEQEWRQLLSRLHGQSPARQLEAVNRFVNQVPHVDDRVNYGVDDHWATPSEFFARGGDCEDFAIAKYVSLRELGWPPSQMRLVIVTDTARGIAHAVLVVFVNGRAHVLDNQLGGVTPADSIRNYRPIYSISEAGWWSHQG